MVTTASNVTYIPAVKKRGMVVAEGEKPKLRVAAYCRVSTDREEQESSFEVQVSHYTKYINENKDWVLAGIYADEGISGMNTKKREKFNKMIDDCMNGKIDMVITKSVSRFARNTMDCLENVRKLKSKGVAVFFEKENINTLDSKGEVFLTIMASLAQQESESIGKNVVLGLQYRYQQGKVIVNYNRFLGYTKNADGKLVIVPEEAAIVRRIYQEYLDGNSWKGIAKGLEADGIRNGAGNKRWWDSNIKHILTNEKYMGDALLQKTYTVDPLEKKRVKNKGQKPQYYVEGCLDPIIPKEMFLLVQREIAARSSKETNGGGKRAYNALSGIVFCGDCGSRFYRIHWWKNGVRTIVWRCAGRMQGKGCTARTVKEKVLQDAIVEALNGLFQNSDLFIPVMRKNIEEMVAETAPGRLGEIDQELASLQNSVVSNQEQEIEIGNRIIVLREEKQEICSKASENGLHKRTIETFMEYVEKNTSISEYNDHLVRLFVNEVKVFPEKIVVSFKAGLEVEVS